MNGGANQLYITPNEKETGIVELLFKEDGLDPAEKCWGATIYCLDPARFSIACDCQTWWRHDMETLSALLGVYYGDRKTQKVYEDDTPNTDSYNKVPGMQNFSVLFAICKLTFVELTLNLPMIWDAMTPMWRHYIMAMWRHYIMVTTSHEY